MICQKLKKIFDTVFDKNAMLFYLNVPKHLKYIFYWVNIAEGTKVVNYQRKVVCIRFKYKDRISITEILLKTFNPQNVRKCNKKCRDQFIPLRPNRKSLWNLTVMPIHAPNQYFFSFNFSLLWKIFHKIFNIHLGCNQKNNLWKTY